MKKLLQLFKNHAEQIIIIATLLLAGISHGWNMFHFPYMENDEGTYVSQAWSLLTQGVLAPYTYWYDHAPAGWMFLALWIKLTGGVFTFGMSVFSGRVFMLILHILMSYFLLSIAKKLTGRIWPGVIAVILFSLSPLAIYFQRRVLLDNLMIFWVLLSFWLLLKPKLKLRQVVASALAFGIGVLSKENAIFFLPGFLYLLWVSTKSVNRKFSFALYIFIIGIVVSFYFLYAFLKTEFFPVGFLGDMQPHVSLVTTLQQQLDRGSNLPFWNSQSDFAVSLGEWMNKDPYIIILAIVSSIVSCCLAIRIKVFRILALFLIFFWLFLLRGKLIIDFYIIPLIPFAALTFGLLIDYVVAISIKRMHVVQKKQIYYGTMICIAILLSGLLFSVTQKQYIKDETTPQINAVNWMKENLPTNAYIIIDDYAYVDLHASRFSGDKVFANADWFWKLSSDPAISNDKYHNDWRNIQYIALSHEMLKQIRVRTQETLRHALDNATLLTEWKQNSTSYFDFSNYISTNGDWMRIYKVKNVNTITMDASWQFYKTHYIHSYGQIIDPSNGNTTSEGQSYAMLRAVYENDRITFDGVWQWTRDHFQYRGDKLLSWLWTKKDGKYQLGDSATATDADEDIALSLLFASKQWNDPKYLTQAKQIINDMWDKEIVSINGQYYVTMGSGAKQTNGYLINPSYFAPASYRIFAQVDPSHLWNQVADDSYTILNRINVEKGNTAKLPSNWIFVDNDGNISSAKQYNPDPNVDNYGYDAFRVYFRVTQDALWFNSTKAKQYLENSQTFFEKQWQESKSLTAIYSQTGDKITNYDSLSTTAGPLALFIMTNPSLAKDMYQTEFNKNFNYNEGYWRDPNNYFDQNWAWFATAMYSKQLLNLWR